MFTLEIVCTSLESALIAQEYGASRVEFCINLEVGGTTPSHDDIKAVKQHLNIPVHIMVSPRGAPYRYDASEIEQMVADIKYCRSVGIDGIVIGCNNVNNEVETKQLTKLKNAAEPMSITYHRAFDTCANLDTALDTLIQHQINRVLTTGGAASAYEGVQTLQHLMQRSHGQIIILPSGGVRHTNAETIIEHTGATEIHSAANILNGLEAYKTEINALKQTVNRAGDMRKIL